MEEFLNFAEIGVLIHFVEIGGMCNMHNWFRGGWTPLKPCMQSLKGSRWAYRET